MRGENEGRWEDIAFIRSTGAVGGWVAAVTDRYKLICSTTDMPWLMDLEKDPDELTNYFLNGPKGPKKGPKDTDFLGAERPKRHRLLGRRIGGPKDTDFLGAE